jgi:type IV secretory pathway ATPase VirB11/archaellum biosynthesis ATPase
MIGEIRDAETADIAVKSALTGHLVLSTVHANDAPGTVTRLVDMGVPALPRGLGGDAGHGAATGAARVRALPRAR